MCTCVKKSLCKPKQKLKMAVGLKVYHFWIFFLVGIYFGSSLGLLVKESSESSEEKSDCRKLPPNPKRTAIIGDGKLNFSDVINGDSMNLVGSVPPDVTLILGNTGCGKTTLTQMIAGDLSRLHAVHTHTGQLVIVDDDERIGVPTTTSRTLIPELVNVSLPEEKNKTLYFYDCPGFDDTRWPEQDLAANFYMNSIVQNATRVKMLFLVTHSSVAQGNDRLDFDLLVKHATKFVRNLKQFENSIGLVVTKVNTFDIQNGKPVKYKKLVNQVVEFLSVYNQTLHGQLNAENDTDLADIVLRKIEFVKILLKQNTEGKYSRIALSRNPNVCGPLSSSEFVADTKALVSQLYKGLQYSSISNHTDFGYTLKDKTIINIQKFTREINSAITEKVNQTVVDFKEWFDRNNFRTNYNVSRISRLIQQSCLDIEDLQKNLPADPVSFIAKLKLSLERMGYVMPRKTEEFMSNQGKFLNFFDDVTGIQVDRSLSDWSIPILDFQWVLAEYRDWYSFCVQVKSLVETYDFHMKKSTLPKTGILNWMDILENYGIYKVENHLRSIYAKFQASGNRGLKHVNILNDIMKWGTQSANHSCANDNTVRVTGNFLSLSEYVDGNGKLRNICPNVLSFEVYAADTLFIDTNLQAVGESLNLAMVAPQWRVIGNPLINLNGANANDSFPTKADDANLFGTNGINGSPGKPGGPGGVFIGVAMRISKPSKLTISVNGGQGGRGQDGGNGATGQPGRTSKLRETSSQFPILWKKERIGVKGEPGSGGGNGGWGGAGGLGGKAGDIQLISGDTGNVNLVKNRGNRGVDGIGGLGGVGGLGSTTDYCYDNDLALGFYFTKYDCNRYKHIDGRNGISGMSGSAIEGLQQPKNVTQRVEINLVRGLYRTLYQNSPNKGTNDFINWWDKKWVTGLLG